MKSTKTTKIKKATKQPKVQQALVKTASKIFKQSMKEQSKMRKIRAKAASKASAKQKLIKRQTKEQTAGVVVDMSVNSFEGVKDIQHLPFNEQLDAIFNPLHSITKTKVIGPEGQSTSTFIVKPKSPPKG